MSSDTRPQLPELAKKAYQPPQLRVYGSLSQLTLSNMVTGNTDSNPMGANNMTAA